MAAVAAEAEAEAAETATLLVIAIKLTARRAPWAAADGDGPASNAATRSGRCGRTVGGSDRSDAQPQRSAADRVPRRRAREIASVAAEAWRGIGSSSSSSRPSHGVRAAAEPHCESNARAAAPLTRSVLAITCSNKASVPAGTVPSTARRSRNVRPACAAPTALSTQRTSVGRSASSASGSAPRARRASSGFRASGSATSPSAPMAGSISVRSAAMSSFTDSTNSAISEGVSPSSCGTNPKSSRDTCAGMTSKSCSRCDVRSAVREPCALSICAICRTPAGSSSGSLSSSADAAASRAAGWRRRAGAARTAADRLPSERFAGSSMMTPARRPELVGKCE